MIRFKNAVKGYDKIEVDEYIHKNTEFLESKIRELQTHIEQLKEENNYLYAKNGEYRRNEERVSDAIIKAMDVKMKLEAEIRSRIEMEEDRLKLFKDKWIAYANGINNSNAGRVVSDIDVYIENFRKLFVKKANSDLNIKQSQTNEAENSYIDEQKRIKNIKFSSTLQKHTKASATILYDEKPNKKLEELCMHLGLMEE